MMSMYRLPVRVRCPVYDMSIEAAAVKLMWVLGHTKKLDEVKKMMETCYVGEFTEKRHA